MEAARARLGVVDWAIANTTLEEAGPLPRTWCGKVNTVWESQHGVGKSADWLETKWRGKVS